MFVTMRRYQLDPKAVEETVQRANAEFAPMLRQAPGFLSYWVVDGGQGQLTTISAFETRQQAEASSQQAATWVKQNLAALLPNPPTITSGEAKVHHQPAMAKAR